MMPVMNGIEFLERLRGHGNNEVAVLPVIVTSAIENHTLTTSRLASKVLKKPIELEALIRLVEEYCGVPAKRKPTSDSSSD
jgi:CheY-like chemotaxis protein